MEIYPVMPQRKKWVKIAVVSYAIYVFYRAVFKREFLQLPIGIIMILSTFAKRIQIINDKGINIVFKVFNIDFDNFWSWKDIKAIHTDCITSKPLVELHFNKDVINRRFIVHSKDIQNIIKMAKKENPAIFIAEVNR